jgi:hypothetical protein
MAQCRSQFVAECSIPPFNHVLLYLEFAAFSQYEMPYDDETFVQAARTWIRASRVPAYEDGVGIGGSNLSIAREVLP